MNYPLRLDPVFPYNGMTKCVKIKLNSCILFEYTSVKELEKLFHREMIKILTNILYFETSIEGAKLLIMFVLACTNIKISNMISIQRSKNPNKTVYTLL